MRELIPLMLRIDRSFLMAASLPAMDSNNSSLALVKGILFLEERVDAIPCEPLRASDLVVEGGTPSKSNIASIGKCLGRSPAPNGDNSL